MGLFERRPSHAGLEDVERTAAHDHDRQEHTSPDGGSRTHGHPTESRHSSGSSGTNGPAHPATSSSSESSLSFANRMLASKHGLKLAGFRGEPHSPHHHPAHFLPHHSNNSRASSTKTSSSSLQAMNEDSVSDARTEPSSALPYGASLARRLSQQLDLPYNQPLAPATHAVNTSADFPVYPDQSYAVLQSQFYPPPYQPSLRGRSSYPAPSEYTKQFDLSSSHGPRTVDNHPTSTPGLFAGRSARTSPSVASDDEQYRFSPYLHPTHLQPPKE